MSEENGAGRPPPKKINTLAPAQKFALWQELVRAREELTAIGASRPVAAEMMSQRLGFAVTAANVQAAVDDGIVSWPRRRPSPPRTKAAARVDAIIGRLDTLAERIKAIEDIVLRLIEAVNAAPGTSGEPMRAPDAWVSR